MAAASSLIMGASLLLRGKRFIAPPKPRTLALNMQQEVRHCAVRRDQLHLPRDLVIHRLPPLVVILKGVDQRELLPEQRLQVRKGGLGHEPAMQPRLIHILDRDLADQLALTHQAPDLAH